MTGLSKQLQIQHLSDPFDLQCHIDREALQSPGSPGGGGGGGGGYSLMWPQYEEMPLDNRVH